jgi:hypothetical protein
MDKNGLRIGMTSLKGLVWPRAARTKRQSSWDRSGRNRDALQIGKGEGARLAEMKGAGCINHIWFTIGCQDKLHLRKLVLRMFWDGEREPSVEVPVGDFFGLGHAIARSYASLPLTAVVPQGKQGYGLGCALNCYFPMPYARSARVEILNECETEVEAFYYYVDYEEYDRLEEEALRFHAQWRRENPCAVDPEVSAESDALSIQNLDGKGNYVILEAEGRGHYVGCNLSVDNIQVGEKAAKIKWGDKLVPIEWWGEGDDMIFVDGEGFPPSLHGTGSEDYFCHAWGMHDFAYPYAGTSIPEHDPDFPGRRKCTSYRFHIEDPVIFTRSIRVTIEHGHANHQSNDYSSTAYWYQAEPHKPFPAVPPVAERLPRPDPEA